MSRRCRHHTSGSTGTLVLLLGAVACSGGTDPAPSDSDGAVEEAQVTCEALGDRIDLPTEIHESSGVAISRQHAGIVWTHNDSGGEPVLFAVDTTGALAGRVRVTGADNVDWEDISRGPCPAGECLYIGEIGDNSERRDDIAIYRVPEPSPGDDATAEAEWFPIRYPHGPQDAESLFVLPSGDVYIVTKGRSDSVRLYRYPAPLRAGETVELETVQEISRPPTPAHWVTGAGSTPDGELIAVRSYIALHFYRWEAERLVPLPPEGGVGLLEFTEPQGEAVDVGENGLVVLTSEVGFGEPPAPMWRLRCELP